MTPCRGQPRQPGASCFKGAAGKRLQKSELRPHSGLAVVLRALGEWPHCITVYFL